jgi:chaperonin cofactor prefoldin
MTENLGLQAAAIVDEKIREYRSLQEELNAHRFDLGTLTAQRNENELVKQVRVARTSSLHFFRPSSVLDGIRSCVCGTEVTCLLSLVIKLPNAPMHRSHPLCTPFTGQELDVCGQEASEGSDPVIYKQVGPVLIKNDLDEARDTVDKRLEFISGEM